jgi:hypothetical protein
VLKHRAYYEHVSGSLFRWSEQVICSLVPLRKLGIFFVAALRCIHLRHYSLICSLVPLWKLGIFFVAAFRVASLLMFGIHLTLGIGATFGIIV